MVEPQKKSDRTKARRRRAWLMALAALVAGATVIFVVFLGPLRDQEVPSRRETTTSVARASVMTAYTCDEHVPFWATKDSPDPVGTVPAGTAVTLWQLNLDGREPGTFKGGPEAVYVDARTLRLSC